MLAYRGDVYICVRVIRRKESGIPKLIEERVKIVYRDAIELMRLACSVHL